MTTKRTKRTKRKRIFLDLAAPLASLRAAAGMTQAQIATARGVSRPAVTQAEGAGAAVSIAILAATAEAAGMTLTITVEPKSNP